MADSLPCPSHFCSFCGFLVCECGPEPPDTCPCGECLETREEILNERCEACNQEEKELSLSERRGFFSWNGETPFY